MVYMLIGLIDLILAVAMYVILAQVILSWLLAFNVLNRSSSGLRALISALDRITEPFYRPIRRILPDFGAIDFAPLVVMLVIIFIRSKVLPGILLEVGPTLT
ncbi:MAG: YggT family protein [Sphingomicrobium sp.]